MPRINVNGTQFEADLVIFDKDGTLLDFKQTWIGILREFFAAIARRTAISPELEHQLQQAIGVDLDQAAIDAYGPLSMGTDSETNAVLTGCLYRGGLRWDTAARIVAEAGVEAFTGKVRKENVQASSGAIDLLKTLKSRGNKTAVATNDNTRDASHDMEIIGAAALIDVVVGADLVQNAKPAPDMVLKIISELDTSPERAVMVGDAISDLTAGKNAAVGLTIGVTELLSAEILAQTADLTIASLAEIR